jgi:hypothetical protein
MLMTEEIQIDEKSKKIEKIYQIIEFEIDNANNQISMVKKDNINFILLFFALIGFFAFIPLDVFLYQWFPSGILITGVMMGCIGGISIFLYFKRPTWNKKGNQKKSHKDDICEFCESSTICENISDLTRKEKIQKYSDSVLIENMDLIYSAYVLPSFFFFLTSMISYIYLTNPNSLKDISSLFTQNSLIVTFLVLALVVYFALWVQYSRFLKRGDLKKYLFQLALFSILIVILSCIILIYGYSTKIPPFIQIENSSQFSPLLVEHAKNIPSFPLSLIVAIYSGAIALVLMDYIFSSRYIEKVNYKLEELFILKYRIDRYRLGISSNLNIEEISRKLSKQKIHPPAFHTIGGIFSIPVPFEFDQCEEILYLALDDPIDNSSENLQK